MNGLYIVLLYNEVRFQVDEFFERSTVRESRLEFMPISTQVKLMIPYEITQTMWKLICTLSLCKSMTIYSQSTGRNNSHTIMTMVFRWCSHLRLTWIWESMRDLFTQYLSYCRILVGCKASSCQHLWWSVHCGMSIIWIGICCNVCSKSRNRLMSFCNHKRRITFSGRATFLTAIFRTL